MGGLIYLRVIKSSDMMKETYLGLVVGGNARLQEYHQPVGLIQPSFT